MIVLDASIVIALLDADDAHHAAADHLLREHLGEGFAMSALTLAEVLVRPVQTESAERVETALRALGVSVLPVASDDALPLARVRATTGVRMPDAVVLHTAQVAGGALATADRALADAARGRGVRTLEVGGSGSTNR